MKFKLVPLFLALATVSTIAVSCGGGDTTEPADGAAPDAGEVDPGETPPAEGGGAGG